MLHACGHVDVSLGVSKEKRSAREGGRASVHIVELAGDKSSMDPRLDPPLAPRSLVGTCVNVLI
jgi:hypothetical protein